MSSDHLGIFTLLSSGIFFCTLFFPDLPLLFSFRFSFSLLLRFRTFIPSFIFSGFSSVLIIVPFLNPLHVFRFQTFVMNLVYLRYVLCPYLFLSGFLLFFNSFELLIMNFFFLPDFFFSFSDLSWNFTVHLDHRWILISAAIFLTDLSISVWKYSFDFRFFRLAILQAIVSARASDFFSFSNGKDLPLFCSFPLIICSITGYTFNIACRKRKNSLLFKIYFCYDYFVGGFIPLLFCTEKGHYALFVNHWIRFQFCRAHARACGGRWRSDTSCGCGCRSV